MRSGNLSWRTVMSIEGDAGKILRDEDRQAKARPELVKKIVQVIREVGAVPKTGKNDHFGYAFRRHEDITNKLQPALANAGIIIVPVKKDMVIKEPGYVMMEVTYEITDGEAAIRFVGIGEGADKSRDGRAGDKATYKAQTGAMKYGLNDLLLLAGEDPENDRQTHKDKDGTAGAGARRPPAGGQPSGSSRPADPAAAKPSCAPATSSKLKPETVVELTDIYEAMGLPKAIREGRMKWSESVGDEKALEKARADCKAHREGKGAANAS
jgi:ERF superfamily